MRKQFEEVNRQHSKFIESRKAQILDNDEEGGFSRLTWLNRQDGKSDVRGRASANAAAVYFKLNKNLKATEKIALPSFGKRGRGNFNP